MGRLNPNGCAWGRETRVMVEGVKESLTEVKESIDGQSAKIDSLIKVQNGKPSWVVTLVLVALCSLCVGLGTFVVTNGINGASTAAKVAP